ncbi:MAG: carboxylating nicotinate-nucleotide diphosphorylase [Actinomycetota bacterium]
MTKEVPELDREEILRVVLPALQEDLGAAGDVTSQTVIPEAETGAARIVAGSNGLLAGMPVAAEVFSRVNCRLRAGAKDGDEIEPGAEIARIGGAVRGMLAAERTALNFLGRLSGIATMAHRYVQAVAGTKVAVRDTRKTTPGLRVLEKYAAAIGGCEIYRRGLFEGVFLKDNHVRAVGGVENAIDRAKKGRPDLRILIEVSTPKQAEEAASAGADEILLDNMTVADLKEAVTRVNGRAALEASGGITLRNVRKVAETGVHAVSVGAITHAAPWLDFSLHLE